MLLLMPPLQPPPTPTPSSRAWRMRSITHCGRPAGGRHTDCIAACVRAVLSGSVHAPAAGAPCTPLVPMSTLSEQLIKCWHAESSAHIAASLLSPAGALLICRRHSSLKSERHAPSSSAHRGLSPPVHGSNVHEGS